MKYKHAKGFTLVELMVALSILAILLGVGVPSFASAVKNSCLSSNNNALVSSLYLARSTAVKSSEDVTLCPRSSATSTSCGTAWKNGWLVFVDKNAGTGASASIGGDDTLIDVAEPVCGDTSVIGFGSSDRTANGATNRNYIRYRANGTTDWKNGSFTICDDRGAEYARTVNIVITGDIRRGRPAGNSSDTPLDVFARSATCTTTS